MKDTKKSRKGSKKNRQRIPFCQLTFCYFCLFLFVFFVLFVVNIVVASEAPMLLS